jgi:alanine-glyoxylate transaminase/(R)-3-amino-2-methylpropionate-pyruvate transaminase
VEVSPGYLPLAYDKVRKAGGLCIADEVQAGFARVGSHFWGFETHGVVPDIVTMAKVRTRHSNFPVPCHQRRLLNMTNVAAAAARTFSERLNFFQGIGNGIPLGAVVTTPEIAQVLTRRCYFNTFGGNPLCTAGGLAVLKVLEKEKLQENAFVVGSYLKDRLRGLQEKHDSACT